MRRTRSGVGGITGRPSDRPCSNANSKGSTALPSSIRRARRGLPAARASSRSAIPGSTERDPQPGRSSGKLDQSGGSASSPVAASASEKSRFQSARPKPTKRPVCCPPDPNATMVGTVSTSDAKEIPSSESSSTGVDRACVSRSFAPPSSSWAMIHTSIREPNAALAASISGRLSSQVGQSSRTKHNTAGRSAGNARVSPALSRSANGGRGAIASVYQLRGPGVAPDRCRLSLHPNAPIGGVIPPARCGPPSRISKEGP